MFHSTSELDVSILYGKILMFQNYLPKYVEKFLFSNF